MDILPFGLTVQRFAHQVGRGLTDTQVTGVEGWSADLACMTQSMSTL